MVDSLPYARSLCSLSLSSESAGSRRVQCQSQVVLKSMVSSFKLRSLADSCTERAAGRRELEREVEL